MDIVDALSPENPLATMKLGVEEASFQQNYRLHFTNVIAQYYGLVQDGMLNAKHLFRGVKRPLMDDGDKALGERVLIYSWRPSHDYIWSGSPQMGRINQKNPPEGVVFVVLVRQETQPWTFPNVGKVEGTIEKWNWVREEPSLPGAPIDSRNRYVHKLWSRKP